MKIAMYSNFLNHHQKDLCDTLYELLGDDFCFVATSKVSQERLSMGYHDMNRLRIPYLFISYDSEESMERAKRLALECDVMIWGSAPPSYYLERVKYNKLTLVYSERIWKKGIREIIDLHKICSYLYHHTRFIHKKTYLLCSSAFAASDFAIIGAYHRKAFKWGYFPSIKEYQTIDVILDKKIEGSILWVGRFIPYKRPLQAIEAARILRERGNTFHLKMIGTGELEDTMQNTIFDYGLEDVVSINKPMSPEQIRLEMEGSSIFIFTSDYGEGWGAVLNEAMNSACGVVVSNVIGSAPFLIDNRHNGIMYDYKSTTSLADGIEELLNNKKICFEFGKNAYFSIIEQWNGKIAANRLVRLTEVLQTEPKAARELYSEGPCSPA